MDLVMPLMSTWIAFSVPAAIGVYWIFQSLLGILQQYVLVKVRPFPKFTEDDYKEAEREIFGKKKSHARSRACGYCGLVCKIHMISPLFSCDFIISS
jgi:hypothetical protein